MHASPTTPRESFTPRTADGTTPSHILQTVGYLAFGLGAAALFTPRSRRRERWVERAPVPQILGRMARDWIDPALRRNGASVAADRRKRALATTAIAGVAAVAVLSARTLRRSSAADDGEVAVRATMGVNRAPEDLHRRWARLEDLPRFMSHIETVVPGERNLSHWVARIPGFKVEWDAEVVENVPGERIAWRALPGSDVVHEGIVRFEPAPGGRGTIVRLEIDYRPQSALAALVPSAFFKLAEAQLREDLRRFKQLLEAGEIPTATAVRDSKGDAR